MGHIHMLLIGMVRKHHGDEGVVKLFEYANLPMKDYRIEEIFPESEFMALYNAAKKTYGVDDEAAQYAFADYFMEESPKLFPAIFKLAGNSLGLFKKVPTIHKQWPSAAFIGDFKEKLTTCSIMNTKSEDDSEER